MSMLGRLTIKGKIAISIVLVLISLVLIVAIVVVSSPPSNTKTVGTSSFEQNPRAYPDYKTNNGSRLTILNPEPIKPHLSEVAISRLETNLKEALYQKNSVIPSVASITSKVVANQGGPLEFTIKVDSDESVYKVLANTDGTLVEVTIK